MKKFKKILIVLLAAAGLWGIMWLYKMYAPPPPEPVKIVLPEKPEAAAGNYDALVLPESAEETYPWDVEFQEDDYKKFVHRETTRNVIVWQYPDSTNNIRALMEDMETGQILDWYYYPSGCLSHIFTYGADGAYVESRWLDGDILIYARHIDPDGSIIEQHLNKDGYFTYWYNKTADHTIELIGDETGKLIECIENGVVIEDRDRLTVLVPPGFRE